MHINSIYSATFPVTCYEMYFLFVVQTEEETLHLHMKMHFKLSLETNFTGREITESTGFIHPQQTFTGTGHFPSLNP